VIAGHCEGHRGPTHTFTPINVWDMRLNGGSLAGPIDEPVVMSGPFVMEYSRRDSRQAYFNINTLRRPPRRKLSIRGRTSALVLKEVLTASRTRIPLVDSWPWLREGKELMVRAVLLSKRLKSCRCRLGAGTPPFEVTTTSRTILLDGA
jgi:hypothetical protein